MTVRKQIQDSLYDELQNITVANGYANTLNEVRIGLADYNLSSNFPSCFIQLGSDIIREESENDYSLNATRLSLDAIIVVYVQNATADTIESIIEDIKKFFNQHSSINPDYVSTLAEINFVQSYNLAEVQPYIISGTNNISGIGFLLKIDYYNFIEDTEPVIPDVPVLSSPADASTVTTLYPVFDWSNAANAESYQIQISGNAGFTDIVLDQSNITNSSFTVPSDILLTNGLTYYWKVRSKHFKEFSNYSTARSFTINSTSVTPLNPNEIGSCILWLRSDTGVALSGSKVTQWNDQSTSVFHLANSTDANRPTLQSNVYGSNSAVKFSGAFSPTVFNCLGKSDPTGIFKLNGSQSKSFMITFIDGTYSGTSNTNGIFARANTSIGQQWILRRTNSGVSLPNTYKGFPKGDNGAGDVVVPDQVGNLVNAVITINSLSANIYVNGELINKATVSFFAEGGNYDVANTFLSLGSVYFNNSGQGFYNGYIFEVGFWNKVLTAGEVDSLYKYHTNFFGL